MNLSDLISEVYQVTSRPDLVTQTASAVKAATLKCHHIAFFDKDIAEQGVVFDTADYLQQLDYRYLFPLWRNAKYFRKFDAANNTAGELFEIVDSSQIFDAYNSERTNIVYLAGSTYNFKSLSPFQHLIVGYYKNPDITEDSYTSWVAVEHPYSIVYEAARILYKTIGLDSQAAEMDRLAKEHQQLIMISASTSYGY